MLKHIWAIFKKDLRDLTRNLTLIFVLGFPVLFGYGFSFLTETGVTIGYLGEPPAFTAGLAADGTISLKQFASEEELRDALGRSIRLGLIFPEGFTETMQDGAGAEFTILETKPGDPLADLVVYMYSQARGLDLPPPAGVQREVSEGYGSLRLREFTLIMALLLGLVMVGSYVVPALILEEKEKGTLRAIVAAGVGFPVLVAGKAVTGFLLTTAVSLLILAMVSAEGIAYPGLLIFVVMGAVFTTLVGLVMGGLMDNLAALNTVSSLVMVFLLLPSILESFYVSYRMEIITKFIPTYWFYDGMLRSAAGMDSPAELFPHLLISMVMICFLFLITVFVFKRAGEKIA